MSPKKDSNDVSCLSTNALCEEKLIQFNASFSPKGSLSFFKHKKGDSDCLIEVHNTLYYKYGYNRTSKQVTIYEKRSLVQAAAHCTPNYTYGVSLSFDRPFPLPFQGGLPSS